MLVPEKIFWAFCKEAATNDSTHLGGYAAAESQTLSVGAVLDGGAQGASLGGDGERFETEWRYPIPRVYLWRSKSDFGSEVSFRFRRRRRRWLRLRRAARET